MNPHLIIMVLLFACGAFFSSSSAATLPQNAIYTPRLWQTADGLPHPIVTAVIQSRDGFIWAGTRNGLVRFDGFRFKTFHPEGDPSASLHVRVLSETRDGALWIGTENGGVFRLQHSVFSEPFSLPRRASVRAICETRDGSVWIGSSAGLGQWKDGQLRWFTTGEGLSNNNVYALGEDADGVLWIGTNHGLNKYGAALEKVALPKLDFLSDSIRAFAFNPPGDLWIAMNGGGVLRMTGKEFSSFNVAEGLPDSFIITLLDDGAGGVWAGSYAGLSRFQGGKFVPELRDDGLPHETIYSLASDREGNLWAGTKEGLLQLHPRIFHSITKNEGLNHNNVLAVLEDAAGRVNLATWGGGLNQIHGTNVSIIFHPEGIHYELLTALGESRDGSLWIGCDFEGGLYRWRNQVLQHFGTNQGLTGLVVRVVFEDSRTNLWVGTEGGLYQFNGGAFRKFTQVPSLSHSAIRAMTEDAEATLWIGTSHGLTGLRGDPPQAVAAPSPLPAARVLALYADTNRALWISTDGGGLSRWQAGRLRHYRKQDGLPTDEIFEIVEDDFGNLWMSSLSGVFRIRKAEFDEFDAGRRSRLNSMIFGASDGMASISCNGVSKPAAWKDRRGRLWFATRRGVTWVDPAVLANAHPVPPRVVITEMLADGRMVADNSPRDTERNPLRVPPGRGEVRFQFAALSFSFPEASFFRYRLVGLDTGWNDSGSRRETAYNNLLPGQYRFELVGSDSHGTWSTTPVSLTFVLLPYFWQTWQFKMFVLLLGLSAVGLAVRFVTRRRMQLALERLEHQHALEKERARIAKDIHDDLGSILTRITLQTELAEADKDQPEALVRHLRKISTSARKTVRSLDEIVWAVNPRNDTLTSLARYISHYASEFFENTGVRCRLEIPVDLPEETLSAEVRHNVFLVVKEALNNILKHANATEVRIQISAGPPLAIVIADDGRGLDLSQAAQGGRNGLDNMRKRMENLGGQFDLQSCPGAGTKLNFTLNQSRKA